MPTEASDLSPTMLAAPDMFLHVNEVKASGIDPDGLKIGDRLTFETTSTRDGKTKASNVRRA
jgi:hypothetical protein